MHKKSHFLVHIRTTMHKETQFFVHSLDIMLAKSLFVVHNENRNRHSNCYVIFASIESMVFLFLLSV